MKIAEGTPSWLARPAPGAKLFDAGSSPSRSTTAGHGFQVPIASGEHENAGPNRTLAQRGSEVFVVAGRDIRWADLPTVKDVAETGSGSVYRVGEMTVILHEVALLQDASGSNSWLTASLS